MLDARGGGAVDTSDSDFGDRSLSAAQQRTATPDDMDDEIPF
jgi:hypothetical protein